MIKKIIFTFFLISAKLYSQTFYVNTYTSGSTANSNKILKLDISNSSENLEIFCPPTINVDTYTDIAIDNSNNFYYVTSPGLLYRKNMATSTCDYLGGFSHGINSLVADSGNYIYGIGYSNSLYRYDTASGFFAYLGVVNIPSGQHPAGDLFFYENKLFVTTNNSIVEINLQNPAQSCPYMTLDISNAFGAFSINYGTYSKTYILSYNGYSTYLYEIDMANKQLGPFIRHYLYNVYGAAATYDLTSTNSFCTPPPLSTQETHTEEIYFNIVNPAKNNIICKTNIDRKEITKVQLFDNTGRLIRDFSNQNNIDNLNIIGIETGTYLLSVSLKKGGMFTKKIIIKS